MKEKEKEEMAVRGRKAARENKRNVKYERTKLKEASGVNLSCDDMKTIVGRERLDNDPTGISSMPLEKVRALYELIKGRRDVMEEAAPAEAAPESLAAEVVEATQNIE